MRPSCFCSVLVTLQLRLCPFTVTSFVLILETLVFALPDMEQRAREESDEEFEGLLLSSLQRDDGRALSMLLQESVDKGRPDRCQRLIALVKEHGFEFEAKHKSSLPPSVSMVTHRREGKVNVYVCVERLMAVHNPGLIISLISGCWPCSGAGDQALMEGAFFFNQEAVVNFLLPRWLPHNTSDDYWFLPHLLANTCTGEDADLPSLLLSGKRKKALELITRISMDRDCTARKQSPQVHELFFKTRTCGPAPLLLAVILGYDEIVEAMVKIHISYDLGYLQPSPYNCSTFNTMCPFLWAIRRGHTRVILQLLDARLRVATTESSVEHRCDQHYYCAEQPTFAKGCSKHYMIPNLSATPSLPMFTEIVMKRDLDMLTRVMCHPAVSNEKIHIKGLRLLLHKASEVSWESGVSLLLTHPVFLRVSPSTQQDVLLTLLTAAVERGQFGQVQGMLGRLQEYAAVLSLGRDEQEMLLINTVRIGRKRILRQHAVLS